MCEISREVSELENVDGIKSCGRLSVLVVGCACLHGFTVSSPTFFLGGDTSHMFGQVFLG